MSADIKKPDVESDDIDLLLLIERNILFLKKYKWVFIIAGILGLALGIFGYCSVPKTYKSRMLVHSYILSNEEEIQIIDNWNDLLKKKEYTALAATFHCPENILYPVKQIKAEEIQKVFSPDNPNGFFIDVNVTDNSILGELQSGIVYGLENSEYIKEKVAVKRTNLTELIEKTSAEIKKLDSTKRIMEDIISGKGKSSSSVIIDPSAMNRQLIEMNEKLLSYEMELKFSNAVQVLQSFNKLKNPVGAKLIVWLISGLMLFLFLAYIYALLNSINRRLKNRARLHSNS